MRTCMCAYVHACVELIVTGDTFFHLENTVNKCRNMYMYNFIVFIRTYSLLQPDSLKRKRERERERENIHVYVYM